MIRFLHGFREVALEHCPADRTILEYLRDDCALTGTKEGCASGDCGACTVVSARATESGLAYEPVNACIAPLGSLHGRQLLSVEDLRDDDGYHPAQQALIDCHGSQCGFCTPGFVMSLFGLFHRPGAADRGLILQALGGNLCRCTGYRPILDAAEQMLSGTREDRFSRRQSETRRQLLALAESDADDTPPDPTQAYLRPRTTQRLAELLRARPGVKIVAGGTDLLLEVTQGLKSLPQLVDVTAIPELARLQISDSAIDIGAGVSHQDCLPDLLADYPECAELMERFGSLQIRSRGTVAGNVANASPIGDWPPLLLALRGELVLMSVDGTRTIPAEDFFLDYRRTALQPGEFIRSVRLPRRAEDLYLRAYKISKRYEDDISSVCAVFALPLSGGEVGAARVAFGGMAAIPQRATQCETALTGATLDEAAVHAAARALAQDFQPISDARASAGYRLRVAQNLLQRLLLEHRGEVPTRVYDLHGQAAHG